MSAGTPSSVAALLASHPPERRKQLTRVRGVIRKHLPCGYREERAGNVIAYVVPLSVYRDTYNGHALWYVALNAEKSHLALHLLALSGSPSLAAKLRAGFSAAGKKLDMGKACIRFQTAEDLALDTVAEVVAAVPLERFVAMAKAARRR
jgi:hypothetical protein